MFGFVAFGFGLAAYATWRRRRWLEKNGQHITAQIAGVDENRALTNKNRHPYFVVAQWTDPATQQNHSFRSESFWFDPSVFSAGEPVDVLVDPRNYTHYYVIINDPTKS